jgi:uncharacterized protein (TIGR02646 family)
MTEAPDFLKENYIKWGREFEEKKLGFHKHLKYQAIRIELENMTNNHCSFCDSYPLFGKANRTVEHFRPKSRFPLLAFVWHNLFLCCMTCQKARGAKYDKKLLKPDRDDYSFSRYFTFNSKEGTIDINKNASPQDQERANLTLETYDLNNKGWQIVRLKEIEAFRSNNYQIRDLSFRFIFE